jgi:hypothetical protein
MEDGSPAANKQAILESLEHPTVKPSTPNYCVNLTRTLFDFSGHSDLTEGIVYGNTRSTNGGLLRS